MKMDRYYFLTIILISLLTVGLLSAQEIDTRRWSIAYWQYLAQQGLVTVTPPDETLLQAPQISEATAVIALVSIRGFKKAITTIFPAEAESGDQRQKIPARS